MKNQSLYERAVAFKKGMAKIKKASIDLDSVSGNGLLNPSQQRRFIDWIFENTQLMDAVRRVVMPTFRHEIHGLIMSSRLARGVGINKEIYGGETAGERASEDQGTRARGVGSYSVKLDAQELALAYDLQQNLLQDNIEGQALADRLAEYMARQFSIDMEELMIKGNVVDRNPGTPISTTTSSITAIAATFMEVGATDPRTLGFPDSSETGYLYYDHGSGNIELMLYSSVTLVVATWRFDGLIKGATDEDTGLATPDLAIASGETITWWKHHLLGVTDGWLYKIENPSFSQPGGSIVDATTINSGQLSEKHFIQMLKSLNRKYRSGPRANQLVWIMNEDLWLDYIHRLTQRVSSTAGDAALEGKYLNPQGKQVLVSTKFPDDKVLLTDPMNLIAGIYKDIFIRRTDVGRTALYKNEVYHILRARIDAAVERADMCVIAEGFVPSL